MRFSASSKVAVKTHPARPRGAAHAFPDHGQQRHILIPAAHFHCHWMECSRNSGQAKAAASNTPVTKEGRIKTSTLPASARV